MRNGLIKTVGATIALALVAGFAPPTVAGELDGQTLRVGSWGGSWQGIQKELIAKKLEAMGAKVEFVKGNPSANLAKLIASRPWRRSAVRCVRDHRRDTARRSQGGFLATARSVANSQFEAHQQGPRARESGRHLGHSGRYLLPA